MGHVHIFASSFAIERINYEPRNTLNTLKMIFFRVFRVFSG
jgi:hypothetical protein